MKAPALVMSLTLLLFSCRDADMRPDAGEEVFCLVDSNRYDAGAGDACTVCDPARSSATLTARADGTSCGTGQLCVAGACGAQCFIDGQVQPPGAGNPDDACEVCAPTRSTTQWSARADGASCGGGEVCEAGACRAKCLLDGGLVSAGELNPANPCEQCTPMTSTTAWSTRANGASCASGKVCEAGACTARCFIGGAFYDANAVNPANPCEQCDPAAGATAWSVRTNGTSCGAALVCEAGACVAKCFIAGTLHAANEVNPQNACEHCDPSSSTTAWTARTNGASCGAGLICEGASCTSKCFIAGAFVDAGVISPQTECQTCVPATSTTTWTPRAEVPLFVGGVDVATQGWTVQQQGNATVTSGADFTRLATSTTTGASSGGQLLLHRNVGATAPYTVKLDLQVEQVNPHNQADSAAAILGAFTPPFGDTAQRSQMIFLDANAVGWADNTQSATFANTNGQYHSYVLSVDATNTARLSVDGAQVLTRANYVLNGVIAVGDQTNDPNVDGAMRIRSISRVCP